MAYIVQAYADVEGDLASIPDPHQGRIRSAIRDLGVDPRPAGSIKMAGFKNAYRIRIGAYRVGYQIFDRKLVVTVVAAGERGAIYRIMKRRLKK